MPTLEQLVTEITNGPLATTLAASWADVFPVEVEPQEGDFATPEQYQAALARYNRLKNRSGQLKPDAAHAIHAALMDVTRTRVDPHVYRGTFLASISPLAFGLIGQPADTQAAWNRVITLACGSDDLVNTANPAVQNLLALAVSQGFMTQEQADAVTPTATPCSRSDELGWGGWPYTLVVEAKASVVS